MTHKIKMKLTHFLIAFFSGIGLAIIGFLKFTKKKSKEELIKKINRNAVKKIDKVYDHVDRGHKRIKMKYAKRV